MLPSFSRSRFLTSLLMAVMVLGTAQPATAEGDFRVYLPVVTRQFTPGPGVVTGVVMDANDRNIKLDNATVCYQDLCDATDDAGVYTISGIPAGWRLLGVSAADHYPSMAYVIVKGFQTVTLDFALSQRVLGEVDYRIVLTWSSELSWPGSDCGGGAPCPNDLDAHLWLEGPFPFHVWYGDNPEDILGFPYARLEADYQNGFGPETVDLTKLEHGYTYHFAVDHYYFGYTSVPPITQLQAQVQVFNVGGLIETYYVPTSGDGKIWYVFRMDEYGTVTDVNCLTGVPSGNSPPQCP